MSGVADIPGASLFEARRKVFPRAVDGTYRRLKWAVMGVALGIYYITPWLRWNRGPYAPDQAVLVDMAHRRFYMFSIEVWPHEFYYVAGLLIMAGIGLFLVTSAVGRAWCGYACPQTVWTDLFQHVERFIDGDRNAQYRLANAPWSAGKTGRRALKYAVWLLIAVSTGGAWIFYFADAPTLAQQFVTGQAPLIAYSTVFVLTMTTFIFGGFMREQVCIYMCPWPRIQGAMTDEQSLLVTYKHWRGEPRTHGLKRAADAPSLADLANGTASVTDVGDCIDCGACVAVCPTGVDIREGSQIGCITCGLCIDACDDMMTKVGRPTRLIGYTTEADAELAVKKEATVAPMKRLLRPRTLIYFTIWGSIGLAMLFMLGSRSRIELSVLRDRNPIWVRLSDGAIRDAYTIKIRNMEDRPRNFAVSVSGLDGAVIWDETHDRHQAAPTVTIAAAPDQVSSTRIFVAAPAKGDEKTPITFTVRANDREGGDARTADVFERPGADQ